MEATYMAMGESAGIAAAIAIKRKKAIQDINRDELTSMLLKYDQKLEWDGKGYLVWRYNIFSKSIETDSRWDTNPEEYLKRPVNLLRK
jgi:hypothetical protein